MRVDTERTDQHRRNGLEAWIERTPPFDCILGKCRAPGCPGGAPSGLGHGRGAARYRWILRGEGLVVQWMYSADEHLPETIAELDGRPDLGDWRRFYPSAWDLGYHAATPMYDGHDQTPECDVLGIPCYYLVRRGAA